MKPVPRPYRPSPVDHEPSKCPQHTLVLSSMPVRGRQQLAPVVMLPVGAYVCRFPADISARRPCFPVYSGSYESVQVVVCVRNPDLVPVPDGQWFRPRARFAAAASMLSRATALAAPEPGEQDASMGERCSLRLRLGRLLRGCGESTEGSGGEGLRGVQCADMVCNY